MGQHNDYARLDYATCRGTYFNFHIPLVYTHTAETINRNVYRSHHCAHICASKTRTHSWKHFPITPHGTIFKTIKTQSYSIKGACKKALNRAWPTVRSLDVCNRLISGAAEGDSTGVGRSGRGVTLQHLLPGHSADHPHPAGYHIARPAHRLRPLAQPGRPTWKGTGQVREA